MHMTLKAKIHSCRRLSVPLLVAFSAVLVPPVNAMAEATIKPHPAVSAPLAATSLMLDIVDTGDGWVAVGERGHVLRSEDGVLWSQVAVPVNVLLTAVDFVDAQTGWAVGHDATVLKTNDGGRSWTLQNFQPELSQPLLDVHFVSPTEGYAVGAFGMFMHTVDAGETWDDTAPEQIAELGYHLNAIAELNDGHLLIVGEMGLLAMTDDDGLWQMLEAPYEGSLYAVEPIGEHGAAIVGMRGNAFRTDDVTGGEWSAIDTGTVQGLTGVARLPQGDLMITGLNRTLLHVEADGTVEALHPANPDANGDIGSFNALVPHGGELLLATHAGVQAVELTP